LTNSDYEDLCTFIVKQWEDLGVKVQVDLLESATLRQMNANGQSSFFRASWIADYPDGENFLCLFYGENPAPPNYTRYSNETVDNMYLKAISSSENSERNDLYQKMDEQIIVDAPFIPLYYDETSIFTSARVEEISINALNMLEVEGLKLSNP